VDQGMMNLLLSWDSGMKLEHTCDIYTKKKEKPLRFTLAHLRRKLIQPGACEKCPKTIVIVGYT